MHYDLPHAQEKPIANQVSDRTVTFVRDEPVKSMLIVAVAGAALIAVASLLSRPRGSQ